MNNEIYSKTKELLLNNQQFAKDVQEGLTASPKVLSSKYFYDKKGDALFQQIMNLDEYYPTRCEYEIFDTYKDTWHQLFKSSNKPFKLIEFGAGDGYKTKILLNAFTKAKVNFQYVPIDISQNVLNILETNLAQQFPYLDVQYLQGDYFEVLENLDQDTNYRKVILFLGGNIGNFNNANALKFLHQIQERLSKDDMILIGYDLKKEPATILNAYNDKKGVTSAFNLNLLERINRELGGNFKLENFIHYPTYNPLTGDTKSYLVSNKAQEVYIEAINQTIHFEAWEAIDTELSKKYTLPDIEAVAEQSGFEMLQHFTDSKKYFVNTIWRKR